MGGGAEVSTTVRTSLKGAPRGPLPPAPSPRPTLPVVQTPRQATSTWAGREGGGRLGCALRLARTFFCPACGPSMESRARHRALSHYLLHKLTIAETGAAHTRHTQAPRVAP